MKHEEDYIKNLKEKPNITTQFLIKNKQQRKTVNNKPYLELTLQDKTGLIKGRMFSNHASREYRKIEVNKIYNITGKVQEFPNHSGKYNILINDIRASKKYDMENFIRKSQNPQKEEEYLENIIESIDNPDLKELIETIILEPSFYNDFKKAPAAKIHHHNYPGGLLVHTNEVVKICESISEIYEDIDRDLLITGAILHDIGKVETYEYDNNDNISINEDGYLLDHIYVGTRIIEKTTESIGLDGELRRKIIHMILSHHGDTSLGWGSAVSPRIPEAMVLHYADDISAKITKSLENM
ncbi:MAG: HD domain-containing protein [Methanosphaera sp.]|nr:HD domain-containing protein [Methanosphaera sp.]